jgi:hypothetical protein
MWMPTLKTFSSMYLGALTSAVTMVLGYYFGSSAGSKEKSMQLDDILDKKK